MANNKEKSIGANFHAQTKYRRGQLPGRVGRPVASVKVYANPLEVAALPDPEVASGPGLWATLGATRAPIPEGGRLRQPQVSQILWAASGFTPGKHRTHVAAQEIAAVEAYLVVRSVQDIFSGVYHYNPREHSLEFLRRGDPGADLADALLSDVDVDACGAAIALTGVPARLEGIARSRAYRYLYLEAGAAAQCAVAAATALELVASFLPDFYDDELARLLQVDGLHEVPLGVVLVGR